MSGKRTHCIAHLPRSPLVMLCQDYIDICDGSIAAAIILGIMEYWTDVKLAGPEQVNIENGVRVAHGQAPTPYSTWVYKSYQEFVEDSLGFLKEHEVREGLRILLEAGFLEKRNNPKVKWDRKLQYRLAIGRVQAAINALQDIPMRYGQRMEESQITDQVAAGDEAIPEITTEITNNREVNVVTTANTGPEGEAPKRRPENGASFELCSVYPAPDEADPGGTLAVQPVSGAFGGREDCLVPARPAARRLRPEDAQPDDDFQSEFLQVCGADRFKAGQEGQPTQKERVIAIGKARHLADDTARRKSHRVFYGYVNTNMFDLEEGQVPPLIPQSWWEWCKEIAKKRHWSAWTLINYLCNPEHIQQHCRARQRELDKADRDARKRKSTLKKKDLENECDNLAEDDIIRRL